MFFFRLGNRFALAAHLKRRAMHKVQAGLNFFLDGGDEINLNHNHVGGATDRNRLPPALGLNG